ncbi:MAG: PKD domain-containing protein [Fibrobacter sp.]|nr:PKD domain-containing protein [Fibrobacter sp.]
MEKLLLKELHLFVAVLGLLCFSACGDDDSSTGGESEFLSVEDLPNCDKEREGKFAEVGGDYYVCLSAKWSMVKTFVESVCNIQSCTENLEGETIVVQNSQRGYQCNKRKWVDSDGEGFLNQEYIDCFVAAVAETASSTKELKKCTNALEGSLAFVGKQLMACYHQEWVKLSVTEISNSDLSTCNKNGEYAFVLSKMQTYECKNGVWDGANKGAESSSSEISQKETSSSSQEPAIDDGVKVRGACLASEKEIHKGSPVAWNFVNMGGTPITYSWTFFKGDSSVETSNDVEPETVFSKGGFYVAKLVINEGMTSESDTIVCSKLRVRGDSVTNCECTTDVVSLRASEANPASATWTVSGCKGEGPFTYQWEGGASGTEASAEGKTTMWGAFAPVVTVTNSDGESMTPVCQVILVDPIISASCSIEYSEDSHVFYAYDFQHFRNSESAEVVTLDFDLQGSNKTTYHATTSSMCEWCGMESVTIELGDTSETLDFYELKYGDDVVCRVADVSCSPSQTEAYVGEPIVWNVTGIKNYTADSYRWTFMQEASEYWEPYDTLDVMTEKSPSLLVESPRTVYATLLLNEGTDHEVSVSCQSVYVNPHPIENCSCSLEMLSTSNDVTQVDEVKYKWKLTGCENKAPGKISYSWSSSLSSGGAVPIGGGTSGVDDETDSDSFIMTMSEMGNYSASVKVSNVEGYSSWIECESAQVVDANVTMLEAYSGQVLEAGDYYITSCDGYGYSAYWYYTASSDDIQSWFAQGLSGIWEDGLYVYYPVRMNIPEGETFNLDYCN